MKLIWTERAKQDLIQIGRFIAMDKPTAARRWLEKIRIRTRKTTDMPLLGHKVPEFNRDDIREVILGSYRIVYLITAKEIAVLTIYEGHRLLKQESLISPEGLEPPGRAGALRLPSPLRTVRDSFPSYGSSISKATRVGWPDC